MPKVGRFFRVIFPEWGAALSGIGSIPFTVLAMYVPSTVQRVLYGITAVCLFVFAAYRIWAKEHERAEQAIAENVRPKLEIELRALFWEPKDQSFKPYFFFRVFAYVCVTNTNKPETLIKNAVLSFTASDGVRYTSKRTEVDLKYKYIAHYTPFQVGGEVERDHQTWTPFRALLTEVNGDNPLRQGIHRVGCLVFAFPDLQNPDVSLTEMVSAKDVELLLIDSYGQPHPKSVPSIQIAAGHGKASVAGVSVL